MLKTIATYDTFAAINAANNGLLLAPRSYSVAQNVAPTITQEGQVDSYSASSQQTIKEVNVRTFNWIAAKQAKNASVGANLEYTVRPGDTVWSILRANGHTASDLANGQLVARVARTNGVMDANRPFPGQKLNIPVRAAQN